MPTIDGAALKELLSNPPVLGALAALLVVLVILAVMRAGVVRRLLLSVAVVAIVGVVVSVILDRMAQDDRAAERRALTQRFAELSIQALAPGSTLACLDGAAGEEVENACEKTVFAGPQTTAGAVAYMAARLTLLADGLAFARERDPAFAASLSGLRRSIELDRFGLAAHVLAVRDGCTAEQCAAFALLQGRRSDQGQPQGAGVRPICLALRRGLDQVGAGRRESRRRRSRSPAWPNRWRRPKRRCRASTNSRRPPRSRR